MLLLNQWIQDIHPETKTMSLLRHLPVSEQILMRNLSQIDG
jgi:hypothetical protein